MAAENTRKLTVTVNIKLVFMFLFPWLSKFFVTMGFMRRSTGLKNMNMLRKMCSKDGIRDCETMISPTIVRSSNRFTQNVNMPKSCSSTIFGRYL